MTDKSEIKVAIVGAGYMADEHARAFAGFPGVSVAGITSRTRAKAEELAGKHGIDAVCDHVAALYAATGADILVVAVDEGSLRPVLEQASAYPWIMLAEKPLGVDLADAVRIAALMEGKPASLYMAMNRRFMGSSLACREDVDGRDEPRFIHVQDQQSFEEARASGKPDDVVRNYMYANSIHLVDYLTAFGRGRVTSVEVLTPWVQDAPGVVTAAVRFESGDFGLYEAIWNGPGPWAVAVSTPSRRWEMRPLEQAKFQNAGERRQNAVDPTAEDSDFKPGLRLMARHAVQAARGENHALTTMVEALETMRLIAAIYGHAPWGAAE